MTITATTVVASYSGDGSTVSFAIPFLFFENAHIKATLTPSVGADTEWTLGTEYTVAGAGNEAGGTLTVLTTPTDYTPAVGETLTIERVSPQTQETSLPLGGELPSTSLERMVDQAVMNIQELTQSLGRKLGFPVSDSVTLSAEIPNAASRASKFLAFDASGVPIASAGPTGDSSIPVSSFIETLLDDANAAAALVTLGAQADLDVPSQAEAEAGTATTERVWTAQRVSQAIAALSGLPRSYLAGLTLSNGADTAHDIDIAVGECRDSTNAFDLRLTSVFTKQIDVAWAAGTASGGLFSGTVAISTWYHVFVIRKDSDGSLDAGFDTSISAANIPAGYTAYRRLGSVLTDGSANILAFTQIGDDFLWNDPPLDFDSTVGTTASLLTLSIPPGVKCPVTFASTAFKSSAASNVYFSSPDQDDEAPSPTAAPLMHHFRGNNADTANLRAGMTVWSNASSQIRARADAAGVSVKFATYGWTDRRGRDG